MKQIPSQCFTSECGKARIYVENDIAIGVFHDFLMMIKGLMVEKMVKVHNEEKQLSEEMKKQEEEENGSNSEL